MTKEIILKYEEGSSNLFKKSCRYIGYFLAKIFSKTFITPNQLTWIGILLFVIAGYAIVIGYNILAGVIILIALVLDYTDGSLARIKNMSSHYGHWLDHSFGALSYSIIFFAVCYILDIWMLGFIAISSVMFRINIYEVFKQFDFANKAISNTKKNHPFLNYFKLQTPIAQLIMAFCIFINQLYLLILFFAIYGWIYNIGLFLMLRSKCLKN